MDSSRGQLAQDLLGAAYDDLTPIQRSVIDLIATGSPSHAGPRIKVDDRSRGERVSDAVAKVGGSWAFIAGFGLALAGWVGWNLLGGAQGLAFDPYPFIFLNLLLSTLAAIQAPIIMMSQNRAALRDREAAEHDYIVNLRAELEIMRLHGKLDRLRRRELGDVVKRQDETFRVLCEALGRPVGAKAAG